MADKKVERPRRGLPLTPTQKMKSALSDPGTVNMAEPGHDKGKAALVDKFRQREERWRREQSLHDQEAAHARDTSWPKSAEQEGSDGASAVPEGREPGDSADATEGGKP